MEHTIKHKVAAWLLSAALTVGMVPSAAFAVEDAQGAESPSASESDSGFYRTILKKNYAISPGVTESYYIINDETAQNQNKVYAMEVEQGNSQATVMASYKDQDASTWGTQVMSAQAASAEAKFGYNVVGAINVNLRFGSDEPMGMLVIDGQVQHEEVYSYGYFVMNKDGSYELRDGSAPLTGNEQQAVTCTNWLVKDGVNLYGEDHAQANRAPRTVIGLKADGTLVLMVNDGRNIPVSVGFTPYESAQMMLDLGCVNVINCDGGGTSTFITEREGTGELVLRNTPSDGAERATLTGLLVISNAKSDGVFDHAAISPDGECYTPASEVSLSATAVDHSGAAASAMPESVTWALASGYEQMGEIKDEAVSGNHATATFVSSGKEGDVVVNLIKDGSVVGTTGLTICKPDELSFKTDSLNLDYEETSDLGLVAKYGGKTVNLKGSDIQWEISDSRAGSFDGLMFTVTNDYLASVAATVTATYAGNTELKASATVNVGMQPTVVLDGGDNDGLSYEHFGRGTGINGSFTWQNNLAYDTLYDENSCDVISYHYTNGDGSSRGGKETLERVTADQDEWRDIIRFGNSAVKINYDFSETNGIEGACLGFAHDIELTGSPTAIGCWVYAPEGTGNFWLRAAVKVGESGAYTYLNFTEQCAPAWAASGGTDVGGINWNGWKYVEADLSQYAGQKIRIIKGETVRVMDCFNNYGITVNGQFGGQGSWTKDATYIPRSERKGWILVDNLQFVYGANNEDVTEPQISKITYIDDQGTETEVTDGLVVEEQCPMFRAYYNDNEYTDRYATGIVTKLFYRDGGNAGSGEDFSNEGFSQHEMNLANGDHSLMFYVKDGNGNVATKTVYFTVDGNEQFPDLGVAADKDAKLYLGDTYELKVLSDAPASNTKEVYAQINMSKNFDVAEIVPAAGYSVDRQSYADGVLTLAVKPNGEASSGTTVATVVVSVPTTLSEGSSFEWRVAKGWLSVLSDEYTEDKETLDWGFSTKAVKLSVGSKYSVASDVLMQGIDGSLQVVNETGNVAAGVSLYDANGDAFIGATDENGKLTTSYFAAASGTWTVYAKDAAGAVSFPVAVTSYPVTGEEAPCNILENAAGNATSQKNVTWMVRPSVGNSRALMQISTAEDMGGATEVEGVCAPVAYKTTKVANMVCSVTAKNLAPNTTYYYRVGNGETWSDVRSFKTLGSSASTNFFVMGDMQGDDAAVAEKFSDLMLGSGIDYSFGVQTGDAVDDVNDYAEWGTLLNILTKGIYADVDFVHALGNHETFGDTNADNARAIFGIPADSASGCYSLKYGNVYVAVFGFAGEASDQEAALNWLKEDAAKSDCAWKVLVSHVPVYKTNANQHDSDYYCDNLPAVAEEVGIDFVFSGHDHSYARKVDGDGTAYYTVGTVGDKKYTCTDNGYGFDIATQDFDSIYLSVSATNRKITVTAYNVAADGTSSVFDSYSKEKAPCPDGEHTYAFDAANGIVTCSACGEAPTGVIEAGGELYYAIDGKAYSGWRTSLEGEDYYYFDPATYQAADGQQIIDGYSYTFANHVLVRGDLVERSDGNYWYRWAGEWASQRWATIDGNKYYFRSSYSAAQGLYVFNIEGKNVYYLFGSDGVWQEGFTGIYESNGYTFWIENGIKNNYPGLIQHEGNYYYFKYSDGNVLGPMVKNRTYWIDKTNGLFPQGNYEFDADGKMVLVDPTKNGIVAEGGSLWYYKDGIKDYAGLIQIDGSYYYVKTSGEVVHGRNYWISKTNGLMSERSYTFAEDGKILDPEVKDPSKDGIVEEGGSLFYYKDGARFYAGLVQIDGSYYYVRGTGEVVHGRSYWTTKTNGLLPEKSYAFADDGKMVL